MNVKSVDKTTNVNFTKRKRRKIPRKHNGELLKTNDFTRKFRNTNKNNNKIVILKINDFTRKVRNTSNKKIVLNSENHLITIKMLSI